MKGSSLKSRASSLVYPLCEGHRLCAHGQDSARCTSCGAIVSRPTLEVLRQITDLPDAVGSHACECGHPEMRLLPDGTRHCPACGSEVAFARCPDDPLGARGARPSVVGWLDGRSLRGAWQLRGQPQSGRWEAPSERLDYYRGHRIRSEARWIRMMPCSCEQGR